MGRVIKADATNPRGKKNVIDGETELLTGFEFNINGKLSTTFFVFYGASIDRVSGAAAIEKGESVFLTIRSEYLEQGRA